MVALLTAAVVVLASITAYFTVIGLASLAPQVSVSMIALGVGLELSKYVALAFVYQQWSALARRLRYTLVLIVALVVTLSSVGVFGYLQASFSSSLAQSDAASIELVDLSTRRTQLEKKLSEIEAEQRRTPDTAVRSRIALIREYESRRQAVASELSDVRRAELELRKQQLSIRSHVGPLSYVAEILNVPLAQAVTWLSLLITITLDPLAMLLSLCLVHLRSSTSKILPEGSSGPESPPSTGTPIQPSPSPDKLAVSSVSPSVLDVPEVHMPSVPATSQATTDPVALSLAVPVTPAPEDPETEVLVYPMPQMPLDNKALPLKIPDERTPVTVSKRTRLLEKG